MKVNLWVKRIRRSPSVQRDESTSAASVSSQWHGERGGFFHHHSPGFLMLWTHEAAIGSTGSSGTPKVQCTVTAVFCFGRRGGRRRLSPQSHLFALPLWWNPDVPQTWQDPFPAPWAHHGMNFQGLLVKHTVLNTTTGLTACRGIIRGTDKILVTLLLLLFVWLQRGCAKEPGSLTSCTRALGCALCSRGSAGSPCVCSPTALLVASETWFVIKQKHRSERCVKSIGSDDSLSKTAL